MKINSVKNKVLNSKIGIKIKKIQEKIHAFESKSILHMFTLNLVAISVSLFIIETAFVLLTPSPNSLYPIQVIETQIVFHIQKALGMPVEIGREPTQIIYNSGSDLDMWIATACTGIHEIVFLSALMIGSRGAKIKTKAKWICIFGVFLFVENLVRLITFYPIGRWIGADLMWPLHYYFWKYGHLGIILTLFCFWFLFVVWRKEILCREDAEPS